MSTQITCPHCHQIFSLDEAQKHEIESMRAEMQQKLQADIEADMKKKAFGWAQEEIKKAKLEAEQKSQKDSIYVSVMKSHAKRRWTSSVSLRSSNK
jgi:hypothetical protein